MLQIYDAYIGDENDGVLVMSLVEFPATEVAWQAFSEMKEPVKFSIDEDKHLLRGVVMLADTPIYRRNGDYEYYIRYSKETLEKMAQKMLSDHTFNTLDTEHSHNMLGEGDAELRELFIKDVENGVSPAGFDEVPDGSLFCTYHIDNEEIWQKVKDGEFKGFSLEGMFSIKEAESYNKQNKKESKMSKIDKVKEILRQLLVEFSTIKTKDGLEIEVGSDILIEGVSANVSDGTYILEDGRQIEVKEGVIVSIKKAEEPKEEEPEVKEVVVEEPVEEEPEAPNDEDGDEPIDEEPVEEPKKEEPITPEEAVEEIVDIVEEPKEIDPLEERVAELEKKLSEIIEILRRPVVEPIRDEFDPENKEAFSTEENYDKWGLKEWRKRK